MSSEHSTLHEPFPTMLCVSAIDINLARDSHKTIESVKLGTGNIESLRDIHETISAGETHREEFDPPFVLDADDRVSVFVTCSSHLRKRIDVPIEINLRDVEYRRDEQAVRSYRKKARNIEVVVIGYLSLPTTTSQIIQSCSQFRVLVIGNSGVGKTSLIRKVFGVQDVQTSETTRGAADIDQEFVSPANDRFVVHDSLGFEAADERNFDIVKQFVARRKAMPHLKDQLHAIWLCIEVPYSGGRLLEAGVERFLQRREEFLGKIPLVVVLTKADLLDLQLELDLPTNETIEHYKARYMDEYCIGPLSEAAGSDVTHVIVSVEDGYFKSLANLVNATDEGMAKYHVDEAPRAVASIAQRVSIKEKIELSIGVGKKRYWKMLLKSAVLRGHTLRACLQVIREDIITVWNFNDPDECLMSDSITNALLRDDNLGETSDIESTVSTFATLLVSGLELMKALSGSGDITLSVLGPVAGIVIAILQTTYGTYEEAKKDVKILMAYIVDLVCVMQAIFVLISDGQVTLETTALALKAYEKPRRFVHLLVDEFDGRHGVLPGGRDYVLEKIEAWIWRHSIADRDVEGLRWRINNVLSSDSTSRPSES